MNDPDEKQIKAELNGIFGKIDKIVKRIDTEDPGKADEPVSQPDGSPPEDSLPTDRDTSE
jgi:hypothetical protein